MAVTVISTTLDSSIVPNTQALNTLNTRMTEQEKLLSTNVPAIASVVASNAATVARQNTLETTFNALVINAGSSNAEIVAARGASPSLVVRLDGVTAQLADNALYERHALDFNILSTNADNHDQIINALNDLISHGGGTLLLPTGIKTSPISFQGYNNITIRGKTTSMPYSIPATLTIVGTNPAGSIGLKFCDDVETDNAPLWSANFCKLENMFIECDNKCDFGINGNMGLELKDIVIRRARVDGIVLANFSYPIFFNKVYSQYNGRHGLRIKGGMTTCYTIEKSEFDYNGGLGVLIEGGARSKFNDCFAQGNAQGGYIVSYKSGITGAYFLENIEIDIYTEANGTLLVADPNYTGNYQAIITSYDKTNNALLKPKKLLIKGALNSPGGIAKALKIDAVYGCIIDATISGVIDVINGGVMGLEFTPVASSGAMPAIGAGFAVTSSFTITDPLGVIYNGLWLPKRGKTQTLMFSLASITAGTTATMLSARGVIANLGNGIKMFGDGSIVGVGLYKGNTNGTVAGTLTIRPTGAESTLGLTVDPTLPIGGFVDLVALATDMQKTVTYNPGIVAFTKDGIIGLQITASADYNAGFNPALVGYVVIES